MQGGRTVRKSLFDILSGVLPVVAGYTGYTGWTGEGWGQI